MVIHPSCVYMCLMAAHLSWPVLLQKSNCVPFLGSTALRCTHVLDGYTIQLYRWLGLLQNSNFALSAWPRSALHGHFSHACSIHCMQSLNLPLLVIIPLPTSNGCGFQYIQTSLQSLLLIYMFTFVDSTQHGTVPCLH